MMFLFRYINPQKLSSEIRSQLNDITIHPYEQFLEHLHTIVAELEPQVSYFYFYVVQFQYNFTLYKKTINKL